jgi:hypothetical protein
VLTAGGSAGIHGLDAGVTDSVPDKPKSPTDEELAEMLEQGVAGKGRTKKRDDNKPSPRLPEALYYYVFMMVEMAIVLGVWGAMQAGPAEIIEGPSLDAPLSELILFNLQSAWKGLVAVLTEQWWVPLIIAGVSAIVFLPTTPRKRKRTASLISAFVVAFFFLLIAIRFADDLSRVGSYTAA